MPVITVTILHLCAYSGLLPLLCVILFFATRIRVGKEYELFFWFVIVAACMDIINLILCRWYIRTIPLNHFYQVIQFGLLAFTLTTWERDFRIKFTVVSIISTLIVFIDQIFLEDLNSYGIYGLYFEGILLSAMAARILYLLMTHNIIPVLKDGKLWIVLSILYYNTIKSVILLLFNQFQWIFPYMVHAILSLICNLLFTWGILCHYKRMRLLSRLYSC